MAKTLILMFMAVPTLRKLELWFKIFNFYQNRIQESGARIQLGILNEKADSAGGKRVRRYAQSLMLRYRASRLDVKSEGFKPRPQVARNSPCIPR